VDPSSPNYSAYIGNAGPTMNELPAGAGEPKMRGPDISAPAAGPGAEDAGPGLQRPMLESGPEAGPPGFFGRRLCLGREGGLPRVYFQVDAFALRLAEDKSRNIAADIVSSNFVLTTRDVEFDFKASPRYVLGYVINKEYQLEVSYFDMANFVERASVTDSAGTLLSPFSSFGQPVTIGLDKNQVVEIRNANATDDVELNLRHQLPMPPIPMAVSFLCGVRYMNIREQFGYFSQSALPAPTGTLNFVTTDTRNDLVGFQIGALFQIGVDPRWWTEFEMKGGIYNNSAEQQTQYQQTQATTLTFVGERDADRTAYVGDLRWSLAYQFGPHLTTHIGYQAIGIHGLALAYQNMVFNQDVLKNQGPAELNHKGSVYYHGPFAGLTVAW
jgi:hypothetical protein